MLNNIKKFLKIGLYQFDELELQEILAVERYRTFMDCSGMYDDDPEDIKENKKWGKMVSKIEKGLSKKQQRYLKKDSRIWEAEAKRILEEKNENNR